MALGTRQKQAEAMVKEAKSRHVKLQDALQPEHSCVSLCCISLTYSVWVEDGASIQRKQA